MASCVAGRSIPFPYIPHWLIIPLVLSSIVESIGGNKNKPPPPSLAYPPAFILIHSLAVAITEFVFITLLSLTEKNI